MEQKIVEEIVERHGWASNRTPGCMPDSYFMERLSDGVPISEIAKELNCTRAAVYNLLKRRGISPDSFQRKKR